MQHSEHNYTPKIVYLNFKFDWVSCVAFAKSGQPNHCGACLGLFV